MITGITMGAETDIKRQLMKNMGRKGFTLLELLIAAALVAVLTMFATQTFRKTSWDIKLENAKRSADTIAVAAYRHDIAYPGETADIPKLIARGFLDNREYAPNGFALDLSGLTVTVSYGGNTVYTTEANKGFVQEGYN